MTVMTSDEIEVKSDRRQEHQYLKIMNLIQQRGKKTIVNIEAPKKEHPSIESKY